LFSFCFPFVFLLFSPPFGRTVYIDHRWSGRVEWAGMDENPYESPRSLAPPSPRSVESVAASKRLRAFGVCCGLMCSAAFFLLMHYLWRNNNSALLSTPAFQYLLLGGVAIIFAVGIAGLVALLAGNAAGAGQEPEMSELKAAVPYGGWVVAGIIVAILCFLVWLATRDPLSIPAG